MSTQILKLIETDSKFIEVAGHKLQHGEQEWFSFPFWFKRVGHGLYAEYRFEDLPDYIKETIRKNREPIKKEEGE